MCKDWLTDEQVEQEIKVLSDSEYVKLARKEMRLHYKRRQALYVLRNLDKRGRQLAADGITCDNIAERLFGDDMDEE